MSNKKTPTQDKTYDNLRKENRVVMRHNIALNIDSFKATTDDFSLRQKDKFAPLESTAPPFASVIIPNFNGERFLPTLLNALKAQTYQDFEIILIDDASTDDSVAVAESTYNEPNGASPPPPLRVIVNRQNAGFVANCNAAADIARGRILVFLNNDTEPEPTYLAALVKTMCANPKAAIVTGKILLFDDRTKLHTTGDLMGLNGIPQNRGVWEEDQGQYDQETVVFGGCGGGSAFRKEVWQALGGFDQDFWMYLEDVDLAFRAQLLGWEAVFTPEARIYHHLSATGGDILASYYVGRNTIWNIAKNMPAGLLFRNFPTLFGAQLQVTKDAMRHYRGKAARARLKGQFAGLVGLPKQLAKRRKIQANRTIEDTELVQRLSR